MQYRPSVFRYLIAQLVPCAKTSIMIPIPASRVVSRGREAVPDVGGQALGFCTPDVKVAEDRSIEPEKPKT